MIKVSTSFLVPVRGRMGRLSLVVTLAAFVLFSSARAWAVTPGKKHPTNKTQTAAAASFSPASGPVGTLVKIKGTGLSGTTDVNIGNKAAILVSASDSLVTAMVMPGALTGTVKLTTDGSMATVPGNFIVTAPQFPSVQEGPKLTDTLSRKPKGELRFKIPGQGAAVAVSADGSTAVVHSTFNDSYSYLLMYKRANNKWVTDTVLTNLLYRFNTLGGNTLTLSADGNTVVVGSDRSGFVSLYRRTNGVWSLTNEFKDLGAHAVSLSADGNTLVIGMNKRGTRVQEVSAGLYIYNHVGSNWVSQPVPIAPVLTSTIKEYQPTPDYYDYDENGNVIIPPAQYRTISTVQPSNRVAISADGKTIAAISYGDYGRYDPFTLSSTSIFILTPTGWEGQATMLTTGPDVKLSADGNTLLEGGSVYVRSGSSWALQQKLEDNVIGSISADGNTVVLGGGYANVYTRNSGVWTFQPTSPILPATPGGPMVALRADGSQAILGMPYDATYVRTLNGYDDPLGSIAFLGVKPPAAIASVTPASGAVGSLVSISGSDLDVATNVQVGGKSAIIINKSSTLITAMVMPGAVTGNVSISANGGNLSGGNFEVVPAKFPNRPTDKLINKTFTIEPDRPNSDAFKQQGLCVAVSADGKHAIVGTGHNFSHLEPSKVLFYKEENGTWVADGSALTEERGDVSSVAINADGTVVAFAATFDVFCTASIYTNQNGVWTKAASGHGGTVSVSADGNTVLTGGNYWGGIVNVYTRNGNEWTLRKDLPGVQSLDPNSQPAASFTGPSRVAISADAKTAAVAVQSIGYRRGGVPGRTVIYTRATATDTAWVLKQTFDEAKTIQLSADGNVMLYQRYGLYTPAEVVNADIYKRTDPSNNFILSATLTGNGAASITADAKAVLFPGNGLEVYTLTGNAYQKQAVAGDKYPAAISVGVTADGTIALLGNPTDNGVLPVTREGVSKLGAVYVYVAGPQVPVTPTTQALALKFTNTNASSTAISWTNGDGAARAVFISKGSAGFPAPANGQAYSANTAFGSGSQVGSSGWFCIYNGTGSTTSVSGLQSGTTYRVAVIEYNGATNEQLYLTGKGSPANFTTTTVGPVAPTLAAAAVGFSNTTGITTTASWTNGNGAMRAVFIAKQGAGFPAPVTGTTYSANTKFAGGSQIGSTGWYCIYNGTGSSVNISNLLEGQTYRVAVIEYNGTTGTQTYLTSSGAPANVTTLLTPPTNQAVYLTFANTTGSSTTANWTNGSGVARAVFVAKTTGGFPVPADNTFYSANPTFGGGVQVGTSGWYCVYNGTSNTVNIAGLTSNTTYRVAVVEYNGSTGTQKYLVSKGSPANVTTLQVGSVTPTTAALALKFSGTTTTATTASWTNGNGSARALFIRKASSGYPVPTDNTGYVANGTYAIGSQIGTTGWYCVYNGTGTTATISGLDANTSYRAMVVEYNGSNGTEKYYTASGSPATVITAAGVTSFARTNPLNDPLIERSLASDDAVVANNILTPNGDGQNDTWTIRNIGLYPTNKVNVMDGRGTVVYSKQGYNNEWNGTYRGTTLPEGTYYYTIDLGNKTPAVKGFFTVVANR